MLKASRMGLGAHLQSDSRVTLNELLATIYGYEVGGYTKNKLIQEGIPVKRRMHDLGIKLKPPRSPTKMWTKEEEMRLLDMKEAGYDWSQIGEKLDRTALACRGKYERMQNPLYMKRYYRDKRGKYEYNGIKDLSPDQIRKSIQEQNDLAEFETVEAK